MYRFIEAEREEEHSVNRACAVLEVSRAAWYEWSEASNDVTGATASAEPLAWADIAPAAMSLC